MSLVLSSREVSAGPTVGFQSDAVVPPSAYVSNRKVNAADFSAAASYCCLEKRKEENELSVTGDSADGRNESVESAELSLESSSIGVAGESTSTTVDGDDDDDEGEEVQSKFKGGAGVGALGSLGSLEESLPIKRGLSNHYSGKSKSFANLSDVSRVEDLGKSENPFNKRRRILMSCKWTNRSFYNRSLNPTTSMPLLAVLDEDEESQTEDHRHHHHLDKNLNKNMVKETTEEDSDDDSPPSSPLPRKFNNFKSGKCFSLTDLQNP
ncbi:hypothetical protein NE237_022169 [Protea cynaroides]|uniref:Uncharacterized protein n=1 Tax=Protea cynaroides TaxID=273540 RepID=A0A9Q0HCN7_9MAGN|nr:hypothetical protein NE237_022169 [Protea cynaroides]